ncbi:MAG: hypothetical protein JW803_03360 [Endomicrobiales bacterium]|nr:hypothetical protein [Endomicrobiales bacterium]
MGRLIIKATILLVIGAATVTAATVTVSSRKILLDGAEFTVRGVNYSPVPVNYDWQYVWADAPSIYNADLPLIKAMGANTIRTYHERNISKAFLDAAYVNGLYVIVGWTEELWDKDFSSSAARSVYVGRFGDFVNLWKDHPAVLMWCFGNEVEEHTVSKQGWYLLLEEAAQKAHSLDPGHPVTTSNQENTEIGENALSADDASLAALDVWGVNIYRGEGFTNLFTEMSTKTAKPFFVSEFGCDAYDSSAQSEDAANQDSYLRNQLSEISSNLTSAGGICGGCAVFEWCDEWWKGASVPLDKSMLGTGGVYGPGYHDTAADWTNTSYSWDSGMNEEWWGMVAVKAGSYERVPRLAYYSVRDIWNPGYSALGSNASAASRIFEGEIKSYPNPFAVTKEPARIEFTVNGTPGISVMIFDLRGDKIIQLDDIIELGSGKMAVNWFGKDEDGNFVTSGLYICRIRAQTGSRDEVKYRKIAVFR